VHLQCPNCQCELDIVAEDQTVEVRCPSCGSQIDISSHMETRSFTLPKLGRLGPFELVEHIGRGHFGDVFKAKDLRLERLVAVKVPRTGDLSPAAREAFVREAQTAASLRHPNIVTVHEVNASGDPIYIASELIDGVNLADLIASRRFEPRQAAEICAQVADALHHAHEQGVIHRDLKPRNIMLDASGEPHLLDFGLAKQSASEFTITSEGDILGTPAYMSPEQARGESGSADPRTDVYALGVTLYEMLTGVKPFQGAARGLIYQILHEEPQPPRRLVSAIPRDLETICLKAMSKSPAVRYATSAEMAADLRHFLAGEPIQARRAGPIERAVRWCQRNPALAAAASLAGVAIFAAGWLAYANASITPGPPKRTVEIDVELAQGPFARPSTDPRATAPVKIVLWPLDRFGNPVLDRFTSAQGRPPLTVRVPPGDYFVVAVEPHSGRFHEVFRRIPSEDERGSGAFRHQRWTLRRDNVVELAPITLPLSTVTKGMAKLEGSGEFVMGDSTSSELPVHRRRVPPYWLDVHEVTIAVFNQSKLGGLADQVAALPATESLTYIPYDQALAWAEHAGKMLPTEAMYEFAATGGGPRKYPWGNQPELTGNWPVGAAAAFDRTATTPPITGLYSSVAEWTSTWMQQYPRSQPEAEFVPFESREFRVVRGAPPSVIENTPRTSDWSPGPRNRSMQMRDTRKGTIGFRCARSVQPHLTAADFEIVLRDGK
jgi:eukaryotic-like serine/threonine-protein kinase